MLKIQSDRVIIDGHEPTKEQCETMTLLANALVESDNFKTVEYRDGYAEFEKVGKAEELKFKPSATELTIIFDSNITSVSCIDSLGVDFVWSSSGETLAIGSGGYITFTVLCKEGYELSSVMKDGSEVVISNNTFTLLLTDSIATITLTSKQSTSRVSVDLTTLPGWASLSTGSHNITVVAKAAGYRDSEPSAAVSVTKSAGFVQVFPSKTSDNYTLFENLNQSKIYSILLSGWSGGVGYLKYENGSWNSDLIDIVYQTSNSVKVIANGSGVFAKYLNGITLEGDTEATTADFEGLSGTAVYAYYQCFVKGTNITLADGSIKPVQDIRYGDEVLCYDFTNGVQTVSYIDWMIPERIAATYWEITLSDGTVLNLVGPKAHRLYNITKQRFDYPQDFEANDLTLKEDGTAVHVISCCEIKKTVRFYNIASHEHINVYANGVLTSNRLNNRYKIVNNKFTDEKVMTDKEVSDYRAYLETIKA